VIVSAACIAAVLIGVRLGPAAPAPGPVQLKPRFVPPGWSSVEFSWRQNYYVGVFWRYDIVGDTVTLELDGTYSMLINNKVSQQNGGALNLVVAKPEDRALLVNLLQSCVARINSPQGGLIQFDFNGAALDPSRPTQKVVLTDPGIHGFDCGNS
jgi:hypothetical protein